MANQPDLLEFVQRVTRKIAETRREKGLTQEQLAATLRIAPRNVQRIESGANVTLYTLARVARALGVDPASLVEPAPPAEPRKKRK